MYTMTHRNIDKHVHNDTDTTQTNMYTMTHHNIDKHVHCDMYTMTHHIIDKHIHNDIDIMTHHNIDKHEHNDTPQSLLCYMCLVQHNAKKMSSFEQTAN